MTLDVDHIREQLAAVFFEEARENVELLENGLLRLEHESDNDELVNEIFRAAHSLKGAAGSFGAIEVTRVAHVMENILDGFRSHESTPDPASIQLLLHGVDGLSSMLAALDAGEEIDEEKVVALEKALGVQISAEAAVTESKGGAKRTWSIEFEPFPSLMQTGNDPLRVLRELMALGDATVEVDDSKLPGFDTLEPETLLLKWSITLVTDAPEGEIFEVFSWVEDDCTLNVQEVKVEAESAEAAPKASAAKKQDAPKRAGSIRVGIDKIDLLMNMVGELVITQSMLGEIDPTQGVPEHRLLQLSEGLSELSRNTRDLQESVMQIRSMPIGMAFDRFPRLVYDLSRQFGKKVDLKVSGETTELDRTVLERLGDPLVHLVRNSLDHGLETPEERTAAGKPETGTIHLNAFHRGGAVVVEVEDDGAGLNRERILNKAISQGLVREGESLSDVEIDNLIFRPGFSTAEVVSDVSGRGVGMDVVRRNIVEVGGTVDVQSRPGQGSKFVIRLPLTLAIIEGQLVRIGTGVYVVPLTAIVESLQMEPERMTHIRGQNTYRLRDSLVPIIDLGHVLGLSLEDPDANLMVVAEGDDKTIGFRVDELLAQQQIVIKSLETNYQRVDGLAGATILGDGNVAFILDVSGLVGLARQAELRLPRSLVAPESQLQESA
ncbi:MAG: chemotaxis protein CheA [Myxococcota bacterium]